MELALLIDFGSTYTKATAVDIGRETLLGTARSFSTVDTNIMEGLDKAVRELEGSTGVKDQSFKYKIACSSAAGGLKMIALGLIPELTVEAARRAALGAGARVVEVFAHELTRAEVGKIEQHNPDIILLAGGTDGGNREVILHNAHMISNSPVTAPIVAAGNKAVAEDVVSLLTAGGKEVHLTENVMPELNVLNINPARETIRKVFLQRIVEAKGLNNAEKFVDGVLMPTPAAVLKAAETLSLGTETEAGLGDLMIVDVGGATTDVFSLASGEPTKAGICQKGLPEPFAKRTVEGDLGMRYSARALIETAGLPRIRKYCSLADDRIEKHIEAVTRSPEILSSGDEAGEIDTCLGYTAVDIAVERHAGSIEVVYTPFGATYVQTGKDLTQLKYLIGTGGIIAFHNNPTHIMNGALFDKAFPTVLKPVKPKFMVDREYIMSAMGLLTEINPDVSLRMMKKYLQAI